MTVPRLRSLAAGYSRRRLRDLRDLGMVVSIAVNDPSKLDEALKAPVEVEAVKGRWW